MAKITSSSPMALQGFTENKENLKRSTHFHLSEQAWIAHYDYFKAFFPDMIHQYATILTKLTKKTATRFDRTSGTYTATTFPNPAIINDRRDENYFRIELWNQFVHNFRQAAESAKEVKNLQETVDMIKQQNKEIQNELTAKLEPEQKTKADEFIQTQTEEVRNYMAPKPEKTAKKNSPRPEPKHYKEKDVQSWIKDFAKRSYNTFAAKFILAQKVTHQVYINIFTTIYQNSAILIYHAEHSIPNAQEKFVRHMSRADDLRSQILRDPGMKGIIASATKAERKMMNFLSNNEVKSDPTAVFEAGIMASQ